MLFTTRAADWLASATSLPAQHLEAVPLRGGISSPIFVIQSACDENAEKFVLRGIDDQEWLA